jgi:hypothetical protein
MLDNQPLLWTGPRRAYGLSFSSGCRRVALPATERHPLYGPRHLRTLANAILDLAAFLELSDDETIDSRAALKTLEWLAYSLRSATAEENAALREAVADQLATERYPDRITFLKSFTENIGLPPSGAV